MKKRNLGIVALLFISVISLNAQSFKKGDLVGNLTIGFGSSMYLGYGYGSSSSSFPAICVSADYGIVDNVAQKGTIGIGGIIGYESQSWNYYYGTAKASDFVIGPRGTFHYPFVDKLDTYVGLELILDVRSWSVTDNILGAYGGALASATYVRIPGFVGARYNFTDKFGALAELGWGIAYFNIGISYKFL